MEEVATLSQEPAIASPASEDHHVVSDMHRVCTILRLKSPSVVAECENGGEFNQTSLACACTTEYYGANCGEWNYVRSHACTFVLVYAHTALTPV